MKTQNIIAQLAKMVAFSASLVVAIICATTATPAHADGEPAYRIQISPTQDNVGTIKPGVYYEGEFEVQNPGTKEHHFAVSVAPYSVSGQGYQQDFENRTKYSEIMDWVTITDDGDGVVDARSRKVIKFRIDVPENAPAGSQSAAIVVKMDNSADMDTSGVQTVAQAAYFFYANIAGETKTTGQILENKIPGFVFEPPIVASSVVKNTGNIYAEARYELEVREFFGNKLAYTNITQDKNGDNVYETRVIFPETERYNEVSWDGAPQMGIFKVKQTVVIFDEVSTVEKIVFLCPMWFLVIVIIFVAVAVFWIVSRITRRKEK